MSYIYRNNTKRTILYRNYYWKPDDEVSTPFPLPQDLGLTCIHSDAEPDPVLFHDDIVIQSKQNAEVLLDYPAISHNVALYIQCMSQNSGAVCRFNSLNNRPIPIDARSFFQVIPWELCSHIFLNNPSEQEVIISITAIESGAEYGYYHFSS